MNIKRQAFFALTSIAILITACKDKKAEEEKTAFEQRSRALIENHIQLLNAHDLKGISAQYSPKARISASEWKGVTTGVAGADQVFHLEFHLSPDAKYLVDNLIVKDSTVVVEYDVVGLKDATNGIRYDVRRSGIFKTDGSRIISEATYTNPLYYHNGN